MITYAHTSPGASMLNKKYLIPILGIVAAGLLASVPFALDAYHSYSLDKKIRSCAESEASSSRIDCWYDLIRNGLLAGGIAEAMDVFSRVYESHDDFANSGCHTHAHWLGDRVYYDLYRGQNDLSAIEFPQSSTACGYGLFHGFLEHLIQDNSDITFVRKTCEELKGRLEGTMRDIGTICYHGAGHGLMLAQGEKLTKESYGNIAAYTRGPIEQCEALEGVTEREMEECKEGLYNVITQWMTLSQYGFEYDYEKPFTICDAEPENAQSACYYEIAQKLDKVASFDPVKLAEVVGTVKRQDLRTMIFGVGMAGIIQSRVADEERYMETLERCGLIDEELFLKCAASIVHGLMEHGSPQQEFRRAVSICAHPLVVEKGADRCWRTYAERVGRFYAPQDRGEVCEPIPDEKNREICLTQ